MSWTALTSLALATATLSAPGASLHPATGSGPTTPGIVVIAEEAGGGVG